MDYKRKAALIHLLERIGEAFLENAGHEAKITLTDRTHTQNFAQDLYHAAILCLNRLIFLCYRSFRHLLPLAEKEMLHFGTNHSDSTMLWDALSRIDLDRCHVLEEDAPDGKKDFWGSWKMTDRFLEPVLCECIKMLRWLFPAEDDLISLRDIRRFGMLYEVMQSYTPKIVTQGLEAEKKRPFRLIWHSRNQRRKAMGSYYTPEEAIEYIVKKTLDPLVSGVSGKSAPLSSEQILKLKVVDPAMGIGYFLIAAIDHLARAYLNARIREGKDDDDRHLMSYRQMMATHCVYGVDLDPVAVELAKILISCFTYQKNVPLAPLNHLKCGHALMGGWMDDLGVETCFKETPGSLKARLDAWMQTILPVDQRFDGGKKTTFFHWEIEFPEVFFDDSHQRIALVGFHAVLGNPPFVRIHKQKAAERDFLRLRFSSAHKDFDLYVCFIEQCVKLSATFGMIGLMTSDKFLVRDYGRPLRQRLLTQTRFKHLTDLSRCTDVFSAAAYPLILILQKRDEPTDSIEQTTFEAVNVRGSARDYFLNLPDVPCDRKSFSQRSFLETQDAKIHIHIVHLDLESLLKPLSQRICLKDLKGVEIFCGTPRARDYHGWKRFILDHAPQNGENALKFIVNRNISPYRIHWGQEIQSFRKRYHMPYFVMSKGAMAEKKWEAFCRVPKVLIRGTDRRITAAVDTQGYVFTQVYGIFAPEIDPYFLSGVFNSNVAFAYFKMRFPTIQIAGDYFSINAPHLYDVPLMIDPHSPNAHRIADLAKSAENEQDVARIRRRCDAILMSEILNVPPEEVEKNDRYAELMKFVGE